jgi:ribonuclease Z
VCIHEATFEDTMLEDAISKKHSTLTEAIEVGLAMNVFRIILTHFSQRYPKLPSLPQKASSKVIVALDSLSISFDQLKWAPKSVPVLQCLFPAEEVDTDAA